MTETQFLAALQSTPLARFMVDVPLAFSVCETFHFIGLCFLLGALLVVDLRVLGLMKIIPLPMVLKFIPVAMAGFAINLVTGVMFFFTHPEGYWTNWMFKLKMVLVILAGLNAAWFTFVEDHKVRALPPGEEAGRTTRIAAALSLVLWISVLIAGRLLPVSQTLGTG